MDDDRDFTQRLGEIFDHAVDLPEGERDSYLDEACGDNSRLRIRVQELLDLDGKREGFMDDPTVDSSTSGGSNAKEDSLVGSSIGSYRLLEQIGEGGYGTVYLAEQREPVTRRVALKIIKLGMDTKQVIARFESERQALAMMEHPNIARVLEAGATAQGRPFFVMELVRGVPITEFCDDAKLAIRGRLGIFLDVCAAVQHAHQKGVIHRDLKPSNILVTLDGDVPMPKIIDFGIAKATGQKLTEHSVFTQFRQCIGTPAYMSPEQAQFSNQDVDTRTDVYALGVLLYELLTGNTPHNTKQLLTQGQEAIFRAIREVDPVKPSTRLTESRKRVNDPSNRRLPDAEVPRDLDWVAMKALEKDRKRRYETAAALAGDVQNYIRGEAVLAAPPSRLYQLGKFIQRHRAGTMATVGILSALLLGLSFAWAAFRNERSARLSSAKALYASDLKVAQSAVKLGDFNLARAKLDAHIPKRGEDDLRGWMWRYLFGQAHSEVNETWRFEEVMAIAVSPFGQVAVAGLRGGERPIEIFSGTNLESASLLGHSLLDARSMEFSKDGNRLFIEQPNSITRLDLETGHEYWHQREGAAPLRMTPDSRHLVGLIQDREKSQPIMHVATYELDRQEPASVSAQVFKLPDRIGLFREFRVSPDGALVTVNTADRLVHVLSITKLEILQSISVLGRVSAIAWSPDTRLLATGYEYSTATDLWEVSSGKRVHRFESDQASSCRDLSFSPDGATLVVNDKAGSLQLWDLVNDTTRTIRVGFPITGYAFYPDSSAISVSGANGEIALLEVRSQEATDLAKDSQQQELWSVDFSPDGSLLAATSADGTVRLYDTGTEERVKEFGSARSSGRRSVRPDDSRVCFSADGRYLFADTGDHTATLYDVVTEEARIEIQQLNKDTLKDMSMSADGKWLGITSLSRLTCWDARDGTRAFVRKRGPYRYDNLADRHTADLVTFSSVNDGGFVAVGAGYSDGNILLLDAGSWQEVARAELTDLHSLDFSPDGTVLCAGGTDGGRFFQVPSLVQLGSIAGSGGAVSNTSFTPDNQTVAIAYQNGHVQIYNRKVQAEIGRLSEASQVVCARFSPTGHQLVVSSLEAGVRFFEAPSKDAIRAIQKTKQDSQSQRDTLIADAKEVARQERLKRYADDPGAIKEWLWLAAIPYLGDPKAALNAEQLSDESTLQPAEGDSVKINGHSFAWRALPPDDYFLDFEKLLDTPNRQKPCIVYACCYVIADHAIDNLRIRTGSDDLAKIYLNGEEIYKNDRGWIGRDLDVVNSVSLREGANTLIFKILNSGGIGNGSLRFTTAEGERVKGISVSLEP